MFFNLLTGTFLYLALLNFTASHAFSKFLTNIQLPLLLLVMEVRTLEMLGTGLCQPGCHPFRAFISFARSNPPVSNSISLNSNSFDIYDLHQLISLLHMWNNPRAWLKFNCNWLALRS